MIFSIYQKAFATLMKKPLKLWGVSLLSGILTGIVSALLGAVPGIALAVNVGITTSMTLIFLRAYRDGDEPKAAFLLDCFKDGATAKRVIIGMLWMCLWLIIWFLIPIVGPILAIIKAYAYRFTPYILMYEPDVAATDAIKVSQERTRGYKGQMFGADILPALAYGVVLGILFLLAQIPYVGGLFFFIAFVVIILWSLFAALFYGIVQAAFYVEIENNRTGNFNNVQQ